MLKAYCQFQTFHNINVRVKGIPLLNVLLRSNCHKCSEITTIYEYAKLKRKDKSQMSEKKRTESSSKCLEDRSQFILLE